MDEMSHQHHRRQQDEEGPDCDGDGDDAAAADDDASPDDAAADDKPAWFTPLRLLCVFCFTNLVVYLDRGVIASNGVNGSPRTPEQPQGSGIQGEFGLTNVEDGLLATAFLVGLLLASPGFSEACKHASAFRLIGIGMGVWTVAVAGCGVAPGFGPLLLCRMAVGVGEASFVALAAPFIDDYAPPEHKARWFATFYLCTPVGFAAGYIFGGVVAAALGWRAAFLLEAAAMVPFVAFAFASRPLRLSGSRAGPGPDPSAPRSMRAAGAELLRDARRVAAHPAWRSMVLGYVPYTAVLGAYAYWGPKAGRRIFDLQGEQADLVFGGVTVATGVAGALGGGLLLDALGATLPHAHLLCGASCLCGLAFVLPAFLWARSFGAFMGLFALAELALFAMQAPAGAIGMWAVPPALRPLAISLTTALIHLLGDVPSPPLVGWLQGALERGKPAALAAQQWRLTMSAASVPLVAAGAAFLHGARVARGARDYRRAGELAVVAAAAEAHHLPGDGPPLAAARAAGVLGGGDGGGGGSGRRRRGGDDEQPLLEAAAAAAAVEDGGGGGGGGGGRL